MCVSGGGEVDGEHAYKFEGSLIALRSDSLSIYTLDFKFIRLTIADEGKGRRKTIPGIRHISEDFSWQFPARTQTNLRLDAMHDPISPNPKHIAQHIGGCARRMSRDPTLK